MEKTTTSISSEKSTVNDTTAAEPKEPKASKSTFALQLQIAGVLRQATPVLIILGNLLNTLSPLLNNGHLFVLRLWSLLEPYHPEEALPCAFGLFMAFFGGHFILVFAAVEAYRLCGWEQTKACLIELRHQYLLLKEESNKDDLVDDNNDGIADVLQISKQELITRKISLMLRSMDPELVSSALSGIWMGFLGVVAVLRVQFAQTIALGATVGGIFQNVANRYVKPILEYTIPKQYHKWIPVIIKYVCRVIGVSIAWSIQRVISGFYSSVRGAQIFVLSLLALLAQRKYAAAEKVDQGSIVYSGMVAGVAFIAFLWQLTTNFSLPFPLSLLMLPLTIVEYFLRWWVAVEM